MGDLDHLDHLDHLGHLGHLVHPIGEDDFENYAQVRDKATGELVQNLTSAAPRFLVSISDVVGQIVAAWWWSVWSNLIK